MTDSDEKQRGLDATMENEASRDLSPMVQISLREYDKLKERSRYITDKDLISMIDKLAKNNIIHDNKAANLKANFAKHVSSLKK